jgi:hypothetical protein
VYQLPFISWACFMAMPPQSHRLRPRLYVDGIDVWGVRTLWQLQSWLNGSSGLDGRIAAAGTDSVSTRA